jgi:hypothetical protein
MKYLIITLLFLIPLVGIAQNTIVLTEEEYNSLVRKAENPTCPKPPKEPTLAKNGFSLRLGGGANYMYGSDIDANSDFNGDYISWYGEGMLGYVFNSDQKGMGNTLGAFVSVGNTNENSIQKYLNNSEIEQTALGESQNLYYKLEFGGVLFQTVRISTGAGYQEYMIANDRDTKTAYYYSSTAGLQVGGRFLKVALDVNFMYGRDLGQTIIRPSAGLVLQL